MSKVRFNLRSNANKDSHIQLIYRIQGDHKKLVIGTKLHVPEKYWNKNSMRVRETKDFPEYIYYNSILDKWEDSINKSVNNFKLDGKVPSIRELKKRAEALMLGGRPEALNQNFMVYFEKFVERRKLTDVRPSTIKLYTNAKNHLDNYRIKKLHNSTIEFQDLDKDFFLKFINYLKTNLELNTIHKIIKQIRTVLNDAITNGVDVNMDFRMPYTQVPFFRQPKIYLDETEIETITSVELEPFSRLDIIRDLLLIGLWTGLRFSDFSRVNAEYVSELSSGKKVLRIKTIKTNTFVTVPLKPIVLQILNKHAGQPPKRSEQKFNQYVKELCKIAGINRRVSKIEKGEQVFYEKWELVSSHICRRSFATNSFKSGIHPKFIMPITGHKSVKQFMEYISIDDEESVELVSSNPFFN